MRRVISLFTGQYIIPRPRLYYSMYTGEFVSGAIRDDARFRLHGNLHPPCPQGELTRAFAGSLPR